MHIIFIVIVISAVYSQSLETFTEYVFLLKKSTKKWEINLKLKIKYKHQKNVQSNITFKTMMSSWLISLIKLISLHF